MPALSLNCHADYSSLSNMHEAAQELNAKQNVTVCEASYRACRCTWIRIIPLVLLAAAAACRDHWWAMQCAVCSKGGQQLVQHAARSAHNARVLFAHTNICTQLPHPFQ